MSITDLFTDLEVLSMIKENDKICIRDGHIAIEQKGSKVQIAIRRYLNHDSRRSMIMEVNRIISQSLQVCNEQRDDQDKQWAMEQFHKHFQNIIEGIQNLKKTYFNDSFIVARLNVTIEMLQEEIKKLNEKRQK